MGSTLALFDLIGAVALLLFGLRLLKAGVNKSFGTQLRLFLASSTRNRFVALGAGFSATLALQSSTAMIMLISSFVAQGLVSPAMAQAVMLGANVGTSVVTQILAFDLHWLAAAAISLGVFLGARMSRRMRGMGEAIVGLGLMLLSLRLLGDATEPMRESPAVGAFFAMLGDAPLIAVLLSAALAAASASSLAVVLFVMALANGGNLDASACLLMVAGANLGGALPPLLSAAAEGMAARRVALSNLAVRAIGTVLILLASGWIAPLTEGYTNLGRLAVDAHVAFNLALAVVFFPLVGPITKLVAFLTPERMQKSDEDIRHLDEAALAEPSSALASATREALWLGDVVQQMLEASLAAIGEGDEAQCQAIITLDDRVDAIENAIKLYVSRLDRDKLDDAEQHQARAIVDYVVNLEHVGDIIAGSLSKLTLKKIERQLQFSADGRHEIEAIYLDTIDNLQLAQSVFLSRDPRMARRLMESKVTIRNKEKLSSNQHLIRLQERHPATLQTTEIHLDILRDLKRINAHLASVAQPILEGAGMLRESRLRRP